MKPLLPAFIFLLLSCTALADNYYKLHKTTATYVPLTNDTTLPNITTSSNQGYEYMMEFNGTTLDIFGNQFPIDDSTYYVYFSTNAHIGIATPNSFVIYDGLFTWLDSIDANSRVSYVVEGAGANRVMKLQYSNLRIRGGHSGNFVNLQMWLYLGTGVVEYHYGPRSANNAGGYTTGPNVGLFYSDLDFTQMYEKIWLSGNPASYYIDSAQNFAFPTLSGVPAEGTVLRFVPKHITSAGTVSSPVHNITLYPNPAADELHVRTASAEPLRYSIADITGKTVTSGILTTGDNTINTSALPRGSYMFTVADKNGSAEVQPLVIK